MHCMWLKLLNNAANVNWCVLLYVFVFKEMEIVDKTKKREKKDEKCKKKKKKLKEKPVATSDTIDAAAAEEVETDDEEAETGNMEAVGQETADNNYTCMLSISLYCCLAKI